MTEQTSTDTVNPVILPKVDNPVQITLPTTAELMQILQAIETEIPQVLALLTQADQFPVLWKFPGLNKLQPYETQLKSLLGFLLDLDKKLETLLTSMSAQKLAAAQKLAVEQQNQQAV